MTRKPVYVPERGDAVWAEGQRMTLEEAVEYARSALGAAVQGAVDAAGGRRETLSRREAQVAAMVAEGMTNRQIADTLVLAERTIEGHVERIRRKLRVRSRTQIAVWLVENRG